ncbi:MAG: hypothetical protein RLZZ28_1659 [Bacteroidota bacterium]|jgi:hypothetical protein
MDRAKDQQKIRKSRASNFLYWMFTIYHYLFGLCGLIASILIATTNHSVSRTLAAGISIICISLFASIQPDHKHRRIETGWRSLDEKLNN